MDKGSDIPESRILSGIRVLDFTRVLAGPYATRMFADCGAEVIKVQSGRTATGAELNTSAYFQTWNRNKRSVTLNMDHPTARNIVLQLTAISDIVIENFSPRVLPNWGLSYEQFKEAKPDIIVASVSAMGQTGPWRNYVGFGPTFHALSGLTWLTSPDKGAPCGPGHAYADTIIGLYSALAILAALEHRDKTGEGRYIDISGYEAACTLLGAALFYDADDGSGAITESPEVIDAGEFRGCYRCGGADRWCVISLFSEEDWQAFCAAAARTDLLCDQRFSTAANRSQHKQALDARIEEWTCNQSPEKVVHLLQGAGIAAGVVQNAEDISGDEQLRARDFFVELAHPVLGTTFAERSPSHFADEIAPSWKTAPLLGADNDYVFGQLLGFTEDEVRRGIAEGLIR